MARRPPPDLTGQVVIVTGANTGLGFETAVALGALGATVVMTARDRSKGDAARAAGLARAPGATLVVGDLDLASFASIRSFASWFLDEFDRLDVLVDNAGLILDQRRQTAEGFEMTFGVNHLGHFLLTDLLRERLVASAPSRVVVLTSLAHRFALGGLDRRDLQATGRYRGFPVYCRSKLANALFVTELARQLDGTGVVVHGVHPGSVNSHFGGDGDAGAMGWFVATFGRLVLRSPRTAARTQVMVASATEPNVVEATGGYFSHGRRWRASRHARDGEAARWLWAESERLVAEAS